MIPTSVTSSSPPTASVGGGGGMGISMIMNNSPTIPGANVSSNGSGGGGGGGIAGGQGNNTTLMGIAALILEGRALAEDEYAILTSRTDFSATLSAGNALDCGRQSPKPSTSRAAFAENFGCGSSTSSYSNDIASYLRRKASNSPESASSSSLLRDYYSSSSESASSSVESNHSRWSQKLSQLRQESPSAHHHVLAAREKIAVECPRSSDAEYVALAINTDHHSNNEERRGDFEIIRRIALNRMNLYNSPTSTGGGGGVGGSSGGGSTENFMCSLQSLASNTCLRVGQPFNLSATETTPRYASNRPRFSTPQQDLSANSASSSGSGVQSPRTSNLWYPSLGPHLGNVHNNKDYYKTSTTTQRIAIPCPQQNNPTTTTTITTSTPIHNLHSNVFSKRDATAAATTTTPTTSRSSNNNNQIHPQQGPHCDQFLKKMGLAKGDASETEEHHCDMSYVNITCTRWRAYCIKMENILARGEPICIEVYLGPVGHKVLLEQWIITQKEKQPPPTMTLPSLCSAIRSQLYFSQISAWCDLIKKSDKTIYETGRLIFNTPTTTITSAAGDLATTTTTATNNAISTTTTPTSTTSTNTPLSSTTSSSSATSMAANTSSSSNSSNSAGVSGSSGGGGGVGGGGGGNGVGCGKRRPTPRLNIFYRIKQYDSTACFNSKPNVHNFPNVNISENCSVSVCLKSLPRNKGGIPKVGTLTTQQQQQHTPTTGATTAIGTPATAAAAATSTQILTTPQASSTPTTTTSACLAAKVAKAKATTSAAATKTTTTNANKPTILTMNCDNNLKEHHQQQQQKTKTAYSSAFSSSTAGCCSSNGKNSKSSSNPLEDEDYDIDFESEHNVDLSAGGDSNISTGGACDGDSSNSSFSTNYCGNLSHREKQLLKYRKRMLKRDKKQQQRKTNEVINFPSTETDSTNNKMEQGEDDDNEDDDDEDDGQGEDDEETDHQPQLAKGQRQRLPNNHINSIPSTNQQHQQQQQQQSHVKMISTGTQTITNTCTACGSEKSMICLKCNPLKNNDANKAVAAAANGGGVGGVVGSFTYEYMEAETSSASSLSSSDIIRTPRNKAELLLQAIQRTPKSNKKHKKSKDLQQQQMAAIEQSTITANSNNTTTATNNNHARYATNNSNTNGSGGGGGGMVGCQVCKRQKTQHNFNQSSGDDVSSEDNLSAKFSSSSTPSTCNNSLKNKSSSDTACDDNNGDDDDEGDNDTDGGKMLSTDCVDNVYLTAMGVVNDDDDDRENIDDSSEVLAKESPTKPCDIFNDNDIMKEEYFQSSTKLTPHIDRCSLSTKAYYAQIHDQQQSAMNGRGECRSSCLTPPLQEQSIDKSSSSNDGSSMMAQFKTPSPSEQQPNSFKIKTTQPLQPHKQTPKPNLLQIVCNFNKNDEDQQMKSNHFNSNNTPTAHNPLLLRRSLPKVNLTPIFCNPTSMMVVSSPIPIGNGVCNGSSKAANINITEASPTFSFESPSSPAPIITVQKSNSAPTLPNSPSLSPRFVKASAIYKRRSRHLSDRSDRSSLGSDEQFSDEDIDSGMYSPFATSPVKLRTRLAAVFGRKPLLGNLEESLLQRRLVPKIEVMGFKLLLGASGGFCPTQLTIPAAAYFYELKGETLSTPYLCEMRLPRKGYTVPRCGTVQATLLNPMGTVVRMFVIPYDMRDMPALHQTFIRQRILADTGLQTNIDEHGVDQNFNDSGRDNATINTKQQQRSPKCNIENHLGHFISAENMKSLRYSIHLRFQTSRSGRLMLHTDIRLLICRRTDCDTAAAHAKGVLEAPNELITNTVMPTNPKYSARQDQTSSKI